MMKSLARSLFISLLIPLSVAANTVSINWLDQAAPALSSGLSWGVPWPQGQLKKDQAFTLKAADGKRLPLQSWPLAYWPDG